MKTKFILLFSLALACFAPAVRAGGLDVDIRIGRAVPPPPPEVIVTERVGPAAPPPWAVSHWYHRSHAYYYYPGSDVYYRPDNRMWFYLDRGTWRSAPRLPDDIRVDFDRSVSLKLETDRPYLFHDRVVAYYPANYFTRVRFKNERDDHRDHRDDHHDNDRHDDHRDDDHRH